MLKNILLILYFTGFIVGSVVRARARQESKRTGIAEDRKTGLDLLLMSLPGLGMLVLPLIYAFTSWLDTADYRLPLALGVGASLAGAAIYAWGVWLLWRTHADLGRNFSPTLQLSEGHTLITQGVYRHIRHPMYAAHCLWGIGQALLLQNWIAGWAMLVTLLPLYLYRVPLEERMMLERFGEEYRAYMARTGRILPRLRGSITKGIRLPLITALGSILIGLPYILHAFGPSEGEVVLWGLVSLFLGIALLALAVTLVWHGGRIARVIVGLVCCAVALFQAPPILCWFIFQGGIMTDMPSDFVVHWSYAIPHIALLVAGVAAPFHLGKYYRTQHD